MKKILVIDNYDSFVYTLVGYLQQLGVETEVHRNDALEADALERLIRESDGVLISPGPGAPKESGVSIEAIHLCAETVTPMLGVCLGHQALAEAFGGVVGHAPTLMHGKISPVFHDNSGVFQDLPMPFNATRYHSLAVEDGTISDDLTVTAKTDTDVIMGLAHRELPLHGVQFHPESVLTENGYQLLANWLEIAGVAGSREKARGLHPQAALA